MIGIVRILIRETVEKPAIHPAKVEEMTTACRNSCKSATGLADLYSVARIIRDEVWESENFEKAYGPASRG